MPWKADKNGVMTWEEPKPVKPPPPQRNDAASSVPNRLYGATLNSHGEAV